MTLCRAAVAVILAGLAAAAFADTVHLTNGRKITDCQVIDDSGDSIVVKVAQSTLYIPKSQVAFVEKSDKPTEFKGWDAGSATSGAAPAAGGAPAATPGGASAGGASGAKKEDPDAVPEDLRKRAEELLKDLDSSDSAAREASMRDLTALGMKITPLLITKLGDQSVYVRRGAAAVMGELGPRTAVKALVEALYAATPETERVEQWNRAYMRNVNVSLEKITGQNMNYNPRSQTQQDSVKKWVEWWDASWSQYPRQIGEPALDEKAADYAEKLKEAKKLKIERCAFAPPKDFPGGEEE